MLLLAALQDFSPEGIDLTGEDVFYVAPTFESGKRNVWDVLKRLAGMSTEGGLIEDAYENTAVLKLVNGRKIHIKGADRPDALRGAGLSFVVLDEYAFMKPEVWEKILSPMLARSKGGALFIGTPEGKNHFYELYVKAVEKPPGYENWEAFHFESLRNPTLDPKEIQARIATMSVSAARQEFGASFNSGGGQYIREEWWKTGKRADHKGNYYIAIDLAGFAASGGFKKGALKVKDEHSIAIVKASEDGWFVEEIITGKWDVKETALRIVKAYRDYRPVKIGIEKGTLKYAVGPYLEDEMKRLQTYFLVYDLEHGNNKKADRIIWALQGRLEKGRITLNEEVSRYDISEPHVSNQPWQRRLIEQGNDFPSPLTHDDMLDSLAYIDQLADVVYGEVGELDNFEIIDPILGF